MVLDIVGSVLLAADDDRYILRNAGVLVERGLEIGSLLAPRQIAKIIKQSLTRGSVKVMTSGLDLPEDGLILDIKVRDADLRLRNDRGYRAEAKPEIIN